MKKQLLIAVLVMGIIALTGIPQSVVAESTNHAPMSVGANNTENGSAYMQGMANRIMLILGIIGGVIIAVLWVFVALEFFSADPQKKAQAKERALWAMVGTIIIVMAVGGAMWLVARWIAGV